MHNFVPPVDPAWGDFCWHWEADQEARCGWSASDHEDHREEHSPMECRHCHSEWTDIAMDVEARLRVEELGLDDPRFGEAVTPEGVRQEFLNYGCGAMFATFGDRTTAQMCQRPRLGPVTAAEEHINMQESHYFNECPGPEGCACAAGLVRLINGLNSGLIVIHSNAGNEVLTPEQRAALGL